MHLSKGGTEMTEKAKTATEFNHQCKVGMMYIASQLKSEELCHWGIKGMKWGKDKITSKTKITSASDKIKEAEAREQTKPWTDKIKDDGFFKKGSSTSAYDVMTGKIVINKTTKGKHVTITEREELDASSEKGRKYIKKLFNHF